jgi:hypothetical protein
VKVVHRDDGWWVTEIHPESNDIGPYTKDEAESHRRCLQKTLANLENRAFFTCEKIISPSPLDNRPQ